MQEMGSGIIRISVLRFRVYMVLRGPRWDMIVSSGCVDYVVCNSLEQRLTIAQRNNGSSTTHTYGASSERAVQLQTFVTKQVEVMDEKPAGGGDLAIAPELSSRASS